MREVTRRGLTLIGLGVLVALVPLGVSAAVTPGLNTGTMPEAVVGVQGPANQGVVATITDGDVSVLTDRAGSYHDVTQLDDGRILATFVVGSNDCGPYPPRCGRTGVQILHPNGSVAWEWDYPVRSVGNSEVHDAELLPSGDLLIVGMDRERVFILNRSTERIVWQWNASSHYDAPADPTRTDWLHMNDVDRIGEGRYLVSVRNANQLVILERGAGVVEVINDDHDPSVIRGQHNPQWLGDRVLVADSSNDRIVELAKQDGEWTPVWSVSGTGGVGFEWPRDADRLPNGHTLITDSRNNRVVIVDEDGDLVASKTVPALPYEADLTSVPESVGGPHAPSEDVAAGTGEGNPPVIGKAYVGVRHALPVPYWFAPNHVVAWVVALPFFVGGAWELVSGRWHRQQEPPEVTP